MGQKFTHATPRTLTSGDQALYTALYGSRFALQSSDEFARAVGYARAPLDDLLVFHVVFGKTVADISLNAVANLGYAHCVFENDVYPGDTLTARSEVIGLSENSSGTSGIVYVRSQGLNQKGEVVLRFVRWVMVRKRHQASRAPSTVVPALDEVVTVTRALPMKAWDMVQSGSGHRFDDYQIGEMIDHVDGVTVEEAEHQMATRLYQNPARLHFNQFAEKSGRFGRRLVYGGHVMSLARALSFNGLANACRIAAINGGRHVAPLFAGQTVFAYSQVMDRKTLGDAGLLRIVTRATRDLPCEGFPREAATVERPGVILELDYWAALPR